MAFLHRISNWIEKPTAEKLNSFIYNYRALKFRTIYRFFKPDHLTAVFPWGTLKVNTDWLGENIYLGSYEKKELMMLKKLLPEGSSAYDIGANIGYYTIYLCNAIKCRKVFAFEPSPREHEQLVNNVKRNGCSNAEIRQFALGDRDGVIDLYLAQSNFGKNSVTEIQEGGNKVQVKMFSLDSLEEVKQYAPDFIKLDVEGAEPLVLRGAAETILRAKPIILYESWAFESAAFANGKCEATDILSSYGYQFFDITPSVKLKPIVAGRQVTTSNLLAIHSTKISGFSQLIQPN